jgi:hypothetical protein
VDIKENGLSDKMDVDEALDLRAPENNVPKSSLKKEMSKARPEYLKLMVSDVNHEGYTPLLEACKQYAIYKIKLMVSDVNHEGYTPLLEARKQYAIYYTPPPPCKHSLGDI